MAGGAALLLLVGALTVVVLVNRTGGSEDLDDEVASSKRKLEQLETRLDRFDAKGRNRVKELTEAREPFDPQVLASLAKVRTELVDGSCEAGRAAARDGHAAPQSQTVVRFVTASAPAEHPALQGVGDWQSLIDTTDLQARLQGCFEEEALRLEQEAQAATTIAPSTAPPTTAPPIAPSDPAHCTGGPHCDRGWNLDTCAGFLGAVQSAGRPPSSGEVQYLYVECGIDYRGE